MSTSNSFESPVSFPVFTFSACFPQVQPQQPTSIYDFSDLILLNDAYDGQGQGQDYNFMANMGHSDTSGLDTPPPTDGSGSPLSQSPSQSSSSSSSHLSLYDLLNSYDFLQMSPDQDESPSPNNFDSSVSPSSSTFHPQQVSNEEMQVKNTSTFLDQKNGAQVKGKDDDEDDDHEIIWLDEVDSSENSNSSEEDQNQDREYLVVSLISSEESSNSDNDSHWKNKNYYTEGENFENFKTVEVTAENKKVRKICSPTYSASNESWNNEVEEMSVEDDDDGIEVIDIVNYKSGMCSPTLSTATTISTDFENSPISSEKLGVSLHRMMAIQREHSYAVLVSPPPSPMTFVTRRRGHFQTNDDDDDLSSFEEEQERKQPVKAARRSARTKIGESKKKIRKIITDWSLGKGSDEEGKNNENNMEKAQTGSREERRSVIAGLDFCTHSDWKWEIEEYSNYLVLGQSSIESNGVFAKYVIPPGVCFVEYKGKRIRSSEADRVEASHREAGIVHDYMFRIDENVTIDATFYCSALNLSKYINHSCSPNAYSSEIILHGKKRIVLVSLREIQEGEEITYDYLFPPETDHKKRIVCNCKSPNCRGFIN